MSLRPALGLFAAAVLCPSVMLAQGYTGEVRVSGTFLEIRGLVRDSLLESAVGGDGLRRTLEDGTVVTCVPNEFCRWFRSGEQETVSLVTQDLRLAVWPGVQGVAAHVLLRGRYGSDDFWPRTDQELEAVYAYVDYERADFRFRGGRLYRTNGLGYYNFDGGSVLWRGLDPLRVDVYGGWSLARSLNDARDGSLLEQADDLATDDRGLLLGFDVNARFGRVLSMTATYQREIRSDELAFYTERVAAAARALLNPVAIDFAAKYDLAFDEFNEISTRVTATLPQSLDLTAHFRHYTPHFELWTIWGAFSPVGYNEAGVVVGWAIPQTAIRVEGGGSYRSYEDTDAGVDFVSFADTGWRGFGRMRWSRDDWFVDGSYRAERGSGAARYGGDIALGRNFGEGTYLALRGSSTQTFSEFRVGDRLVSGLGINGGVRWNDTVFNGSYGFYRVSFEDQPRVTDWDQQRGYVGITYRVGNDPAVASSGANR